MELKKQLDNRAHRASDVLMRYMPVQNEYTAEILEAMNYSISSGGKRLRPVILESSYKLFGGHTNLCEPFMAAMEMLHNYSLVHDDLPAIDNDELRRGIPTTHAKYGQAVAILAGDGLLHLSYETALMAFDIADAGAKGAACDPNAAGTDTSLVIKALKIFGECSGLNGMFGGQSTDVINTGRDIDDKMMDYIHEHKTGALIEGSLMIGGVLAGANDLELNDLKKIGKYVGMAFQIRDDILDEIGDEAVIGKPTGSDDRNNKKNYISVYGMDKAICDVKDYTDKACDLVMGLGCDDEERQFLTALFKSLVVRDN